MTIFTLFHKALYAFNIDQKNNLYFDNLENEDMPLTRYKLLFDSKKINLESDGYKFIKKSIQKGGMIFEYISSKK